jgi:hypothetical protein
MILDGTNGETFPSWTTATRPASPTNGQMGYNTTTGLFDQYVNSAWQSVPYGTSAVPQVTVYTSGSGTYTVPTNAKYLYIKMCAGGGGGSGAGTPVGPSYGSAGTIGGNTTFGTSLLTCNGGIGGAPAGGASVSGSGGSSSIGAGATGLALVGGAGVGVTIGNTTATNGCAGGVNPFGGGGGLGNASSTTATPNTGAGGVGGLANGTASTYMGTGGGAGGYIEAYITSPSATYAYAVGAGGAGGAAGSGQFAGTTGFSGVIIITAYF